MAKLPESTMADIRDAVSIFDRMGDGKVAVTDIINLLRSLDLNPGSDDWNDEINDYVRKDVLRIDVDEFASIYAEEEAKKKPSEKELIQGLKAVDPQNGEAGIVSRPALMRYLTNIGDTMTVEEADVVLNSCLDKDGRNVVINDIMKLVMGDI